MRRIFLLILFIAITLKGQAQDKNIFRFKSVDVEIGVSKALGKDIKRVFNWGSNQSFGLNLSFFNNRVSIIPFYNYKIFSNSIIKNTLYENLFIRSLGGKFSYNVMPFKNKKIYFYPFLNIAQTRFKEFLILYTRERSEIINASMLSFSGGIGFSIKNFYWEISYLPINGNFSFDKNLVDDLTKQGYTVEQAPTLSFSNYSISAGFHIPLYKNEK
jgi:hypothetical protein